MTKPFVQKIYKFQTIDLTISQNLNFLIKNQSWMADPDT